MIVRKSAFNKSETKAQTTYISAVQQLNKNGEYTKFVNWHANMGGFRMHGMGYPEDVGVIRFLAWHRIFLIRFEKALQKYEPSVYIPYWKWVDGGIPKWIEKFEPTVKGVTRLKGSHMSLKPTFQKPKAETVNRNTVTSAITTQKNIDRILNYTRYNEFSTALERGPHNRGHMRIGGVMQTEVSPADPMFWLHHANVDRIWALWQKKNPTKHPEIIAAKGAKPATAKAFVSTWSTLQPFGVSLSSASKPTTTMGYSYA